MLFVMMFWLLHASLICKGWGVTDNFQLEISY